jgi:hypothetical protein
MVILPLCEVKFCGVLPHAFDKSGCAGGEKRLPNAELIWLSLFSSFSGPPFQSLQKNPVAVTVP